MSSNNQIVLIGRVGNEPQSDVRELSGGNKVVEIRLAVNRPSKDSQGKQQTDWLSCKFWNRQAEILSDYVHKGDLISVSGSLRVDSWEKEGHKRNSYYILADNFQMLGGKKQIIAA